MSKLLDLIDRRIEEKTQGGIKYEPAVILSVREDYLRADVKLLGNGAVIEDMLNKSGEKLSEGQNVRVAYLTLPSAGWIALTNGEADPLNEGGGGVEVDTAAIFSTNLDDILIEQELMMTITPETKLYYGGMPQFAVVQGHYCLLAGQTVGPNDITYDSEEGKWLIWGDDTLYDAIIENKNKFGTQMGTADDYGLYFGTLEQSADGVHYYPQSYTALIPEFNSITHSSTGWSTRIDYHRWLATNNDPMGEWYGNITHPTATRENTLYTYAILTPRTPTNGNNNTWISTISDFFIVPVISNIAVTGQAGRDYGSVTLDNYLFFATAEGYDGKYSVTRMNFNGNVISVPLISEAENAFMRGLYQRSEPQEVTP